MEESPLCDPPPPPAPPRRPLPHAPPRAPVLQLQFAPEVLPEEGWLGAELVALAHGAGPKALEPAAHTLLSRGATRVLTYSPASQSAVLQFYRALQGPEPGPSAGQALRQALCLAIQRDQPPGLWVGVTLYGLP